MKRKPGDNREGAGAPAARKTPWRQCLAQYWQLYAMAAVPLAYFILFKWVPVLGNVLAFRRYRPLTGPYGVSWVGIRYFKQFLSQPQFWNAFRNTLILAVLNLLVNFPLPILFALLLNEMRTSRFRSLVQTVSFMPRFISTIVVISILTLLLSPSGGLITRLMRECFGRPPVYYMNEPGYFRALYILTDAWQHTGWTAIVYLAAIAGIPDDLYEAARIDGANRFQQVLHVTIPSILPTIMVMLILKIGNLLSLGFEKVLLMYTPANSSVSDIIDTYVYRVGLQSNANQYSYATAIGLFSGVIGLILVCSTNFLSRILTGESLY
jgi:putative aldouronate transport system permease protein